jgi:diaminohydroxyphosphoribosylaminopyrimidine deaminase/5-amino-6-(5-phosphoribosylamino)uracil reductase
MAEALISRLDLDAARTLCAELGVAARAQRFEVAPNPCVGAALVRGTEIVARGVHRGWGGLHAETQTFAALHESGGKVEEGDVLFVTLEPCSSQGKQPPCTDAILASGVRHVVVAAVDPDPRQRGRGLEALAAAGVEVELLDGAAPLAKVAPHFLDWISADRVRRPRPWLIAKWAQTRTGQLVPPPDVGSGRWITAPPALEEVQALRARVDAIVTGSGTVLADDPRLTVRRPVEAPCAPLRIVLDSDLRTPPSARLFQPLTPGERGGSVHLFCLAGAAPARHRELEAAGAIVHGCFPDRSGRLSLREVLGQLWALGVRRALLEAGPTLQQAFLDQDFVDQVRVYTGPVNGGRGATLGHVLAQRVLKERLDREVGPDSVLEAFLASRG